MNHRLSLLAAVLVLAILRPVATADVRVDGENMSATSKNITVWFRGGDLIGVKNHLTGEQYSLPAGARLRPLIDMATLSPPVAPLRCTLWRPGRDTENGVISAQTTFTDMHRTIWLNVVIDQETQDIVITIWGESKEDGVTGLTWGLRGLDYSKGKLILPAQGGVYADSATAPSSLTLDYPTQWEAQMGIWQGQQGGFVFYSRDEVDRFKKLHLFRRGDYADIGLETETEAPWTKASSVPQLEWRINAYKGDWRVPAVGYRNLMAFTRKPVATAGGREWVRETHAVVTVHGSKPDPSMLETLAKQLIPARTLLYLPDWRKAGYDVNYPDYTPADGIPEFVQKAHALGFRVMLHTDLPGVSPSNPDFERVKRFQVKDARSGSPIGWRWDKPESDPQRFAFIDPASPTYRALFIERLRPVMEELHPDALHLDVSGPMWNDANGTIADQNYAQGSVALHRALLTAFPDLVLGGEGINELVSPYEWFAQRWIYGSLPAHPISSFLFGDHVRMVGYLGEPNPDQAPDAFLRYFSRYEKWGVLPTLVISGPADLAADRAGMQRQIRLARAWEDHQLEADWAADWTGTIFRWTGTDGVAASLEAAGPATTFRVGKDIIYQRVTGVNRVVTSRTIPGWPAYDDSGLLALDPLREYWLDQPVLSPQSSPDTVGAGRRPGPDSGLSPLTSHLSPEAPPHPSIPPSPHLSAVPDGLTLADAQFTPDFALFRLTAAEKLGRDLLRDLPEARTGTILDSRDAPLGMGATAERADVTVGGETRPALFEHPPWQALPTQSAAAGSQSSAAKGPGSQPSTLNTQPVCGATFVEFDVRPRGEHPALSFAVGISDDAAKSDGVTFRVTVEGKELWSENVTGHRWLHRTVDLSAYAGQDVKLRLITDPGPRHDTTDDHAAWSDVRLVSATAPAPGPVTVSIPPGAQLAGITGADLLPPSQSVEASTGTTHRVTPSSASATNPSGSVNRGAQPRHWSEGLGQPSTINLSVTPRSPVALLFKPGVALSAGQSLLDLPPDTALVSDGIARPGAVFGGGAIDPVSCGGIKKDRALNAHPPDQGQSVFSWLLKLPDSDNLHFTLSAGLADGAQSSGAGFLVRVDGEVLWTWSTRECRWKDATVDLGKWRGKSVILQLVTDSLGDNGYDWARWADLTLR